MANFKNTGDIYVSKSGSDANPGTDPNNPKLTIQGALTAAAAGNTIVVGDGIYEESELLFSGSGTIDLFSDGLVILSGDNTNDAFSYINVVQEVNITGLVVTNYLNLHNQTGPNQKLNFIDCKIFNSPLNSPTLNSGKRIYLDNTVFVNSNVNVKSTVLISGSIETQINNCIFINSTLETNFKVLNSVLESNVTLTNEAIGIDPSNRDDSDFNNINGNITYDILYSDLSSFQSANPTLLQNCINVDSLFNRLIGETVTLDYTVQGSSLLLGVGENGTNIGAVRRGLPQSRLSASVQNGTNTNIVFDRNVWQVQAGQTTGSIETDVIDFGLTVKSPKLTIKGIVNFLDNVPDFDNALLNPNKLDIEARYAIIGEDISLKTYKPFLLNERILLDVGGLSNGEALFDWANTVTQPMKEIQLRITLRQDYNPA